MSITHPGTTFAPVEKRDLASRHPQLMPFLVAVGLFVVCGLVALSVTGLPT